MRRNTKPITGANLDPRAKAKNAGNRERKVVRQKQILDKRMSGLNANQIAGDLGLAPQTVYNELCEARKALAAMNGELTKQLRDKEAEEYLALLSKWLPIALCPLVEQEFEHESGRTKKKTVFNPAAAVAAGVCMKAKFQLARLYGLNLEKPMEPTSPHDKLTRDQTLVMISQQIIFEHPKPKNAVERFGCLDVDAEPIVVEAIK